MRPVALLAVLLIGPGLAHGAADDPALPLTPGEPATDVGPYLRYRLADPLPLGAIGAVSALPADAFEPLPGGRPNFGFTGRTVWVTFAVVNTADAPGRWRVSTDAQYAIEMGIWQERGGEIGALLESTRDSAFFAPPGEGRPLSAGFELGPGEESRILIGMRRTGVSSLSLVIDTEESFAARRFVMSVANAGVYAAIACAALLALLQLVILRDRTHLAYLVYVASVTLYLVQTDGLAFQYLWPGSGRWNEVAALPFGLLNGMAAAHFARIFLATRRTMPRLDRILLAFILVSAVSAAAGVGAAMGGVVAIEALCKQSAIWISLAITVLCMTAGVMAYRRGQKSVRFYLAAWIGTALATLAWGFMTGAQSGAGYIVGQYVTKGCFLFDMLMFLLAMADQARELRAARDRALEAELRDARRQQKLDEQLQAAAEARLSALLLAEQRTQRLAEATHDIRQPLLALKLTLARMLPAQGPVDAAHARFAAEVERLESLVRHALERVPAPDMTAAADPT